MNLYSFSSRRAQLKPLNYKTPSAFPGPDAIKIHYFLPHSHSQCPQNQCWRDATGHTGMYPLSFPSSCEEVSPQAADCSWSLVFLSQPHNLVLSPCPSCVPWVYRNKFHLTANFWEGGIKGKFIPFLKIAKTKPPVSHPTAREGSKGKYMVFVVPDAALVSCYSEKCYRKVGYFIYISI